MAGDCASEPCGGALRAKAIRGAFESAKRGEITGPRAVIAGPLLDGPASAMPGAAKVRTAADARREVASQQLRGADFVKPYSMLPRDAYLAAADEASRRSITLAGHLPFTVTVEEALDAHQRSIEHSALLAFDCSSEHVRLHNAKRWTVERDAAVDSSTFGAPPDTLIQRPRQGQAWEGASARVLLSRAQATFSAARCDSVMKGIAQRRSWLTPTQITYVAQGRRMLDSSWRSPWSAHIPAELDVWWRGARTTTLSRGARYVDVIRGLADVGDSVLRAAVRAHVPILAGSDAGNPYVYPGFDLHTELELLVESGLSPLEALRTATLNAAIFLDRRGTMGSTDTGNLADLVLLDANPLNDIRATRAIRAVVANGRLFTRPDLDEMLRSVTEPRGQAGRDPTTAN